jgi:hypothetical protein
MAATMLAARRFDQGRLRRPLACDNPTKAEGVTPHRLPALPACTPGARRLKYLAALKFAALGPRLGRVRDASPAHKAARCEGKFTSQFGASQADTKPARACKMRLNRAQIG